MVDRQTEEYFELPVSLRIRSPQARVFEEWVRPRDLDRGVQLATLI